jgi:adenine-specific DNA methylase
MEASMLRCLSALPPYAGGKRRLLGRIFKHLPPPSRAGTFVDPFLGGGSVSLMAKAKGYRVLCNDIAERAHIVGKALIENDRATLSEADTLRFFVPHAEVTGFVRERFAPDVLTRKHAAFLDNALAVARGASEHKRWLLLLVLLKYVLRCRPMGNFGAKTIVRQLENRAWDAMNPHYLRDALARTIYAHPRALVEKMRLQVNRGVFSNGHKNETHRLDALEFLIKAQGEILYLDPPYPGTQAYEGALRPLDEILAGHPIEPERSRFSGRNGLGALEEVLSLSARFPIWVVSYGNAQVGIDEVTQLIEKFRPVGHAEEIRYVHCTGLAGAAHRERNRELLVVARRKQ